MIPPSLLSHFDVNTSIALSSASPALPVQRQESKLSTIGPEAAARPHPATTEVETRGGENRELSEWRFRPFSCNAAPVCPSKTPGVR